MYLMMVFLNRINKRKYTLLQNELDSNNEDEDLQTDNDDVNEENEDEYEEEIVDDDDDNNIKDDTPKTANHTKNVLDWEAAKIAIKQIDDCYDTNPNSVLNNKITNHLNVTKDVEVMSNMVPTSKPDYTHEDNAIRVFVVKSLWQRKKFIIPELGDLEYSEEPTSICYQCLVSVHIKDKSIWREWWWKFHKLVVKHLNSRRNHAVANIKDAYIGKFF